LHQALQLFSVICMHVCATIVIYSIHYSVYSNLSSPDARVFYGLCQSVCHHSPPCVTNSPTTNHKGDWWWWCTLSPTTTWSCHYPWLGLGLGRRRSLSPTTTTTVTPSATPQQRPPRWLQQRWLGQPDPDAQQLKSMPPTTLSPLSPTMTTDVRWQPPDPPSSPEHRGMATGQGEMIRWQGLAGHQVRWWGCHKRWARGSGRSSTTTVLVHNFEIDWYMTHILEWLWNHLAMTRQVECELNGALWGKNDESLVFTTRHDS